MVSRFAQPSTCPLPLPCLHRTHTPLRSAFLPPAIQPHSLWPLHVQDPTEFDTLSAARPWVREYALAVGPRAVLLGHPRLDKWIAANEANKAKGEEHNATFGAIAPPSAHPCTRALARAPFFPTPREPFSDPPHPHTRHYSLSLAEFMDIDFAAPGEESSVRTIVLLVLCKDIGPTESIRARPSV